MTAKPLENILYYYRCPKCDHVSIYVTHTDWLSCGYRRCGLRFIRFGNTMDEWEYKRIWDGSAAISEELYPIPDWRFEENDK